MKVRQKKKSVLENGGNILMARCKDCARKNECAMYILEGEPIMCFNFMHEGENSTEINLKQNSSNPLNDPTKGYKDVKGKLPVHLVPPEAVEAMAEVFGFGAKKYDDRNWEKGLDLELVLAAAERHILQHKKGITYDDESGLPHLYHALTDLAMIIALTSREAHTFSLKELLKI